MKLLGKTNLLDDIVGLINDTYKSINYSVLYLLIYFVQIVINSCVDFNCVRIPSPYSPLGIINNA